MERGPRWLAYAWRLPQPQAAALAEALTALGWLLHAVSSAGAVAELTVYAERGRLPPPVRARLAALPRPQRRVLDAAQLAAFADALQAHEIAPGWWVDPRGGRALPAGARRVLLPPAPAFGDGRHPTTRLLARWLADTALGGRRVLDLGCGTGILGLIARAQGARRVDFIDNDPLAVRACRQACRANGYRHARVRCGDLLDALPDGAAYDLVLANLYADVVLRLLADPRLPSVATRLWLCGIAQRRATAVRRALRRAGYAIEREEPADDWWLGLAARRVTGAGADGARSAPGSARSPRR